MIAELVRTDDIVLVSFIETLLRSRGIEAVVLDRHLSGLHGAVGLQPQRIAVAEDDWAAARLTLVEAGLGAWITSTTTAPQDGTGHG